MLKRIENLLEKNPGQKAKALASQLRVERSEINQILHRNSHLFIQETDGYTWSLAEIRVDLGSHHWLDVDAFERSLRLQGSPLDSSLNRVVFVVGEGCSILLEALARLLAICNQLVDAGKYVAIDFNASGSTLTYLNRIGFIDLLRANVKILPRRPRYSAAVTYEGNNDAVVELRAIDHLNPDDDIPSLLRNSFVSRAGDQYNVAVHTVITELFGNVSEHSGATSAGFAGLQCYRGGGGRKPHIQTVISDGGRGIIGTLMPILKDRYPKVAEKIEKSSIDPRIALLQEVFSRGGISQVNEQGRGLGLKGAGGYAQKYNALISVRQDTFEIKIQHLGEKMQFSHSMNLAKIVGTHICFDFFLD